MKRNSRRLWMSARNDWLGLGLILAAAGRLAADSVVMIGGDQTGFPAEADDIVALSAGSHHALAVRANGSVLAWGKGGADGRLTIPQNLDQVVGVAAGKANGAESHSVAVRSDGTVVCWGGNSKGQCEVPDGLGSVVAVAAGSIHTAALKSDRTVVSWGGASAMHSVLAGWADIVQIEADATGTAGLKGDGTLVLCQFDGTTITPAIDRIAQFALRDDRDGWVRLVALQVDGTLVLWSRNPESVPRVTPPGPVRIVAMASGELGVYLLMADHTVQKLAEAGILDRGPELTDIAAGADYRLLRYVRSAPEISMVGESEIPICSQGLWWEDQLFVEGAQVPFEAKAQIRLKNRTSEPVSLTEISCDSTDFVLELPPLPIVLASGGILDVPVSVSLPTPGTRRALLRVTSSEPRFATRQLPLFAHGYPPHPRPGSVVNLMGNGADPLWGSGELTDAVAVAAGSSHALALRVNGSVVGRGNTRIPSDLRPAVKIAAGDGVSTAIHRDGTLTVWGDGPRQSLPEIRTPYGVVEVSAGVVDNSPWFRSPAQLALKADGSVVPLLRNVHFPPNNQWPFPPGWSEADGNDVIQIAAGRLNVVLLKRDGTVHGVGESAAPPEGLASVTALAAGGIDSDIGPRLHFQVALKADGSVVSWGDRDLGLPDDLTDIAAVSAGGRKVLFLRADGTLTGYFLHSPPTATEWSLLPGIRDVSAIAVGGRLALAIAPPLPEWHTPFRSWMQERAITDWAMDPDQNGFNHWEDWIFATDLDPRPALHAALIRNPNPPGDFIPVVRLAWRAGAPAPILQWSPDLLTWGTPTEITYTFPSATPPSGMVFVEYRHSTQPTSRPPSSEFFRALPP